MKLLTLLKTMDDHAKVIIYDEHVHTTDPKRVLFSGKVRDCKKRGAIRNGVVKSVTPYKHELLINIDIEYQKKKALKEEPQNETIQHRTSE